MAQLIKASDTRAVGRGFDPHPDIQIGLKILFRSDHI